MIWGFNREGAKNSGGKSAYIIVPHLLISDLIKLLVHIIWLTCQPVYYSLPNDTEPNVYCLTTNDMCNYRAYLVNVYFFVPDIGLNLSG